MGEHASKGVVFGGATFESIDNTLIAIRRGLSEDPITNSRQHDFAKTMWSSDQGPQDSEGTERESDSVNHRFIWQMVQKPRREFYIGFWVVWLVLVSVPQKIETNRIAPHIGEESVNSRLLPGFAETAAPTMN
jgi:hypothetical protein